MIRAFCTLFALLLTSSAAQAACLSVRESKPKDWYDWAQVLVAADVTGVSQRGRYDVIALRVVEAYKGPERIDTLTLEVPQNFWAACKIERPKVGERVLGALNSNNDANVVPLDTSYADQLAALRPAPIAKAGEVPPAAPAVAAAAEAAPAIPMQCVRSPVYGATVKVESCEQGSGALFLRGEVVRAAQENSADEVPGLPIPEFGKKFTFAKPGGQCSELPAKNPSITGRLSHPCCDKNQPYCAKKTDFLIDDSR
ncbi:MAG TPA: hypothetical protein VL199_01770 [Burkholderiales bacterium]|jgi:hypothetical protein|nr:hypothetical protein [Burkholderiales bacterium]